MFFRSTGLGATELTGIINNLERRDDYLVMHVNIINPVKWKVRAALSFKDFLKLATCCIKFSIISFLISPKQWVNKEPKHPGEF